MISSGSLVSHPMPAAMPCGICSIVSSHANSDAIDTISRAAALTSPLCSSTLAISRAFSVRVTNRPTNSA